MDRRALANAVLCLPLVMVVTAFLVAQTQLARVIGTASWTVAVWPAVEWSLCAALVAAWYHHDWPRWVPRAVSQTAAEAAVIGGMLSGVLWLFVPGVTWPALQMDALLPTCCALVPLALWCAAEETVLRGVLARVTAPLELLPRVVVLAFVSVGVMVVTGQVFSWTGLIGCVAIESLSIIGLLAGQPVLVLAQRRFWIRAGLVLSGISTAGFMSGIPALWQVDFATPMIAGLVVVTAAVLWGCLILIEYVVAESAAATKHTPRRQIHG